MGKYKCLYTQLSKQEIDSNTSEAWQYTMSDRAVEWNPVQMFCQIHVIHFLSFFLIVAPGCSVNLFAYFYKLCIIKTVDLLG